MLAATRKLALSKISKSKDAFNNKKYVLTSLYWMLTKASCGLALAPGLGKTLIALLAISILKDEGEVRKTLLLAKRRIIRKVWPDEIAKWGIDLDAAVVHGTPKKKLRLLQEDHDVYLMTYESLFWLYAQSPKIYAQFDMLVCDESSKIKGWSPKRSKLLRLHLHEFKRRYCLTGSLQPNSEMDLFMPTYVLDLGKRLGRFITQFRNRWFYPSGFDGHDWRLQRQQLADGTHDGGDASAKEIAGIISDVWLHYGEEELDLPPLVKITHEIELGEPARNVYDDIEEEFMAVLDAGIIVAPNKGVAGGKLRQITGGAIYTRPKLEAEPRKNRPWQELDNEKIDELDELIDDLQGTPLLIAYEFDHERQRIQKHFPWMRAIGGGTSDAEADESIDMWNRGELVALLGQPDSIAHGLNLQGPEACICFYSIGWNFENHDQFIKRVWRQGQRFRVFVHYLVARNTVDEDVVANLSVKGSNQKRLYQALLERNRKRKGPNTMTAKAKTKKRPAAKTKAKAKGATPKKKSPAKAKAAPEAEKRTRLRLRNDVMLERDSGAAPPIEGSIHAIVQSCVRKGKRASLESVANAFIKKRGCSFDYARDRIMRAIKAGHLKVAA